MSAVSGRITIEPGKRGGNPCIRGLRITVWDVLGWLGSGMSETQILDEHPDLEQADFPAVYQFAAETGRHTSPAIPAPPYQPWMSLLLDENLSPRPVERLASLFPGLTHVRDLGLKQASDRNFTISSQRPSIDPLTPIALELNLNRGAIAREIRL